MRVAVVKTKWSTRTAYAVVARWGRVLSRCERYMMSLSISAEWHISYSCADRIVYIAGLKITPSH